MKNDLITGRDIVVVGQQPWDVEIGSNNKNLAIEFSKNNRVLYVNSALDTITLFKNKQDPKVQMRLAVIDKKQDGLIEISNNLWTYYPDITIRSINWIKSNRIFNFLNKNNNKRFAESIAKAIKRLDFKNIILFNDSDIFRSFYLKEFLKPAVSVYYSRDYLLTVDYWKRHGSILEPLLIAKSDLCTANSTYLADYCAQYNPKSYYVGQGCDLSLFDNSNGFDIPEDIKPIKRPVIGYVGALQSLRLDIELLEYVARQRPGWSIVLVGPEDDVFKASGLHHIGNIHFLGSKDASMLPAYINAFDVCINPQMINQITIGNYPRKIDEYLVMGKPTVATATRAMEIFGGHAYLGKNKEEYITLIQKALDEDSPELQSKRKAFATSHSWENNAKEIYKAINTYNQ
ncbi:glycosyl transferase family 1 [Mucilaginibacter sp. PPCGB 2223]|uniref:glycosyltransferase n=1 Tax=Mucilaginibacter sp. PPCGB 2223 TaxID=1886027 RepID=UPI00082528D9|nr:glycosyltransferase [Mucilaginibacter sp. PPCGB 2223]OCX51583.1 glycosyl transferase family 1 [Mucilaginibacter sp. PPCGB 2223]